MPVKAASTYRDVRGLLRLKENDSRLFDVLDFTGFSDQHGPDAFDTIFPKRKGRLNPPEEYLLSGRKVREWMKLTTRQQQEKIERIEEQQRKRVVTESRGRSRADRVQKRSDDMTHDVSHIDRLASSETTTPVGRRAQQQHHVSQHESGGATSGENVPSAASSAARAGPGARTLVQAMLSKPTNADVPPQRPASEDSPDISLCL